MVSRIFKTAILVLFLLLNGCGNTPSEPEVLPDFPLEQGEHWAYAFSYRRIAGINSVSYNGVEASGQYILNVANKEILGSSCIVTLDMQFIVDSTYFFGTRPDFSNYELGIPDTSCFITLEMSSDTLWLQDSDSLVFLMPLGPHLIGQHIDFRLFSLPWPNFSRVLPRFGVQSNSKYVCNESNSEEGIYSYDLGTIINGRYPSADFDISRGGLTRLMMFYYEGEFHSSTNEEITITLTGYTPSI